MDKDKFIEGEKSIRRRHHLLLLVDLLYYYYTNSNSFEAKNVLNSLQDSVMYNSEEKDELLKEAIDEVLKKYHVNIKES